MPAFAFNPAELQRLRRLVFSARLPTTTNSVGQHRVRRSGEGLEFLDYRSYSAGDDFRKIDWALYGRLRELFVRLTEVEECLYVSILVDVSDSMCFGSPVQKVELACQLACALSYVALANGDRVQVATFAAGLGPILGPVQGVAQIAAIAAYLRDADSGGQTDLVSSVMEYCRHRRHRGLVVLIGDFLGDCDHEKAIGALASRRDKLLIAQVLDDLDYGIGLDGHCQLCDSETGCEVDVTVDHRTRRALGRRVESHTDHLAALCRRYEHRYVLARTNRSYLELACQALRDKAVLR